MLDTLVHALVHGVDDCQYKHGKEFKKIALNMGLKGPMLKRFLHFGPPLCPQYRIEMEAIGDGSE